MTPKINLKKVCLISVENITHLFGIMYKVDFPLLNFSLHLASCFGIL